MRTILAVTVSRSDWGIYLPVLRQLQAAPGIRLVVAAGGMHQAPQYGQTILEVRREISTNLIETNFLLASDSPESIAKSVGLGVISFAQLYQAEQPDILLVLGDRYEMFAAAIAALPYQIPVAHIHGGELSLGAMDDAIRHSITKLSHLHFVATAEYARRVMQLGEEPWRVIVSGAPALDRIATFSPKPRETFYREVGLPAGSQYLLVTYHPVTTESDQADWQIRELLSALAIVNLPVLFTSPNADTYGHIIRERILAYCEEHRNARYIAHCGCELYYNAMYYAAAMVGNSSSGIIEAPSFKLPVVNIGTRQAGRIRAANVLDSGYERKEIIQTIHKALNPEFRSSLKNLVNPYGDGHASKRIARVLSTIRLDNRLLQKRFYDLHPLGEKDELKQELHEEHRVGNAK
ncbi:GDP/UDP-N,N'-diacetylbacillosamine 2-epimerase (hydrolyzing) [bacterium HR36]|nr:GDP/UDP-N,N'-diacetylbacillosamine 2-epimerase (hydrolyzing) [bacterium HR36]